VAVSVRERCPSPRRRGLRLAIYEAGLGNVFTELTGGARQIGFALLLGARDVQVGILSALPFLANLAQLTASFLLERTGQCKLLSLVAASMSRVLWIGVILLPLGLFGTLSDFRVWAMVMIVALSSLFVAMNNTFWLSWLGDLVPARLRGRYFGRRNMVIAAVSMSVPLLASAFLDAWEGWFSPQHAGGFLLVFALGILCSLAALAVQWRMPIMPLLPRQAEPFFSRLSIPLRDTNFRRFIVFHLCWGASVYLAGPFFTVYMLQDLHLSYTVITALASLTALCNMLGMRFWGQATDRFSAKPVMLLGGIGAALLPGLWILTAVMPAAVVLPVVHVLGGFSWAGFNLNLNTLLLALAPRQDRSIYLGVYAALTGLSTAAAPVVGGLLGRALQEGMLPLPPWISPYLLIFALSCLLRLLSLLLFLRVHEPREVPLERLLLVFGNLRTFNAMVGFDALLHHGYLQGERLDHFVVSRSSALRQALVHFDQTTDAYAAEAEAHIKDILEDGEEVLEMVQERSAKLDHHLDTYVEQSEARIARWLERLAAPAIAWWQRFRHWRDDDN
jgi:MFS family permease